VTRGTAALWGLGASLGAGVLALAGSCDFTGAVASYCQTTGVCACDGGDCCVTPGNTCDDQDPCCGDQACVDFVCGGPVVPDAGPDAGPADAGDAGPNCAPAQSSCALGTDCCSGTCLDAGCCVPNGGACATAFDCCDPTATCGASGCQGAAQDAGPGQDAGSDGGLDGGDAG